MSKKKVVLEGSINTLDKAVLKDLLSFKNPGYQPRPMDYIPTASHMLNYVTRGGIPRGKTSAIVGPTGGGKTTLALVAAKGAQDAGGTVLWMDMEDSFPLQNAQMIGIDMNRIVVVNQHISGEEAFHILGAAIEQEIDLVVWDSVADTAWQAELEAAPEDAIMMIAARKWAERSKALRYQLKKYRQTAILFINQLRSTPDKYNPESEPGGKALQYGYFLKMRTKKKAETATEKGVTTIKVGVYTTKNKIASKVESDEDREVVLRIQDGDMYLDPVLDMMPVAKELGVFTNKNGEPIVNGTWHFDGRPIGKSKDEVIALLSQDDELFEQVNERMHHFTKTMAGSAAFSKAADTTADEGESYDPNGPE